MSTKSLTISLILILVFGISVAPALACDYVVGDINGSGAFNGVDVVFAIAWLSGGTEPPYSCECPPGSGDSWFVAGDVNASCHFNGVDVTYMVNFMKGGLMLQPCPACPPTP
jgi:hypothetical protein